MGEIGVLKGAIRSLDYGLYNPYIIYPHLPYYPQVSKAQPRVQLVKPMQACFLS